MTKNISFAHFNTILIVQTPSILSTFVKRGDNEDEILVQSKLTASIVASADVKLLQTARSKSK